MDVSTGPVLKTDPVSTTPFAELRLPEPAPIPCIDLYEQLAQKLHAASNPTEDRPRDLVDIWIIDEIALRDDERLREATKWTFGVRNTHEFPSSIDLRPHWVGMIQNIIDDNRFNITVDAVAAHAQSVLDRIRERSST